MSNIILAARFRAIVIARSEATKQSRAALQPGLIRATSLRSQ
jgi:hypothetical protein